MTDESFSFDDIEGSNSNSHPPVENEAKALLQQAMESSPEMVEEVKDAGAA